MIDTLIDKQDTTYLVRDAIAQILADETASQQALATAAAKDPNLWKFRVYRERSNPWESWLNPTENQYTDDTSPIVNVWFDNDDFEPASSNIVERQKASGTFNIDCYAYAISEATDEGHTPGDAAAAHAVQSTMTLVRNILLADVYTYLGFRGTVWKRWPQSITAFQPQLDGQTVQKVLGMRLAFNVDFNEFSPQATPDTLETLAVDIKQAADGQVIAQAEYTYT